MNSVRRLFPTSCSAAILVTVAVFLTGALGPPPACAGENPAGQSAPAQPFTKGRSRLAFGGGSGLGLKILGSRLSHDIVFGWLDAGRMLSDPLAEGKWYTGNFEVRGEFFGGLQYEPKNDYFIGLTPFIRYNLTAHKRIVPFFEAGMGVSLTDIGSPDLGGKFQFNLRGGFGVHYFVQPDRSFVFQAQFLHFSNGGLKETNNGLNAVNAIIGYNWFF